MPYTDLVSTTPLWRQPRPLALAIAALAVLIFVVVIVATVAAGGSSGSPLDAGLKATANRLAPGLDHPGGKLPIQDSTLRSFQAWVYDARPVLLRAAKKSPHGQWEEAELIDPNTLPPLYVPLYQPGHVPVVVTGALINQVTKSHKPAYATIQQGSASYRVYAVPFTVPLPLQPVGVTGMFEVIQAE